MFRSLCLCNFVFGYIIYVDVILCSGGSFVFMYVIYVYLVLCSGDCVYVILCSGWFLVFICIVGCCFFR